MISVNDYLTYTIVVHSPDNEVPVTRQRLRRMFKYLSKKRFVRFIVSENTSIGRLRQRVYAGKISSWEVSTDYWDGHVPYSYHFDVVFTNGVRMEEGCPADAIFTGLANIRWFPGCYVWADWGARAKKPLKEG